MINGSLVVLNDNNGSLVVTLMVSIGPQLAYPIALVLGGRSRDLEPPSHNVCGKKTQYLRINV
jgi:hypothetical protein